ncbi:sugar ABC transporter permease [Niveibacterium umoris]|uniref:Xylose transport system permease protein XylH n=1 Tax=Niveibacterium umoris TaxID=1193620 RepID=A0A840BK94_9RHOO|nr:sugar ABC transporter permease [Niveibacterium umoris]MBB4013971.1 D-xylose transport system permease protein [Niveibacterium umoris]
MSSVAKNIKTLFGQYKVLALGIAIVLIWSFFGYMTMTDDGSSFLTSRNFSNLLRQMAITGMLASGMVFVIIAGEIDLSVGSLLGLLGGLAAVLDATYKVPVAGTIAIVCFGGVLAGLINGYWVSYLRVPSFIVGLAGMLAFRGVLVGLTQGSTVPVESAGLIAIGQAYLPANIGYILALALFALLVFISLRTRANRAKYNLTIAPMWQDALKLGLTGALIFGFVHTLESYQGVPVPVLVLLVIAGAFSFMANSTVFGRRIYAIGSNLEATRLSGVNVQFVKMTIFGIMGLMCAFAGLTTTARLASGSPSAGNMGELDAIASCFIGGTSMRGGAGTVSGAMIGALIMTSLDNGMSMLGVETFWQMIVKGSILLLAVWVDVMSGSNER